MGNSLLNTRKLPESTAASRLHTDQSRRSCGNAGISIHYNEALPFWLQWSVWGNKKQQEKLKPTQFFFAETLQLSGEGDLLAIAIVYHSNISKVAEERIFAAVGNFQEMSHDWSCFVE